MSNDQNRPSTVNLAFTGASGAQYGLRLLQCLVSAGCRVNVMVSRAAQVVIATETDLKLPGTPPAMRETLSAYAGAEPGQVLVFGREDWFAPPASGSGEKAPLVVCPCSTGTLSALATGASNNLIERAGDVEHVAVAQAREVSRAETSDVAGTSGDENPHAHSGAE